MSKMIKVSYTAEGNIINSENHYFGKSLACCLCGEHFIKHQHWSVVFPQINDNGYVCCDECDKQLQNDTQLDAYLLVESGTERWVRNYLIIDGEGEGLTILINHEC